MVLKTGKYALLDVFEGTSSSALTLFIGLDVTDFMRVGNKERNI
jgi:hypothetical protein